ncbi:DUF502 domain-containing protein [Coxiella-like endosymbiont]|uniref:DUF502 domain-containing protein n=1 Tax=Coxiella-like endosymbiont TaxID=1592897 RepID=UPI00272B7B49|nr:DUF502 domain-containing protein [Coxiella-like endosymbiont]
MKGKPFIRRYLIAGLLVWLPIWVTFIVIRFLVDLLDSTLRLLPHRYQPEQLFGHDFPGLGLIFTLIIILLTGLLVTNFIGRQFISWWEKILARIPLVRSIYIAVKQVTHAFVQPKGQSFRKVVLVEFPRRGTWSVGFVTANDFKEMPLEEKDILAVFVPTTPNPTSGFLMLASQKDVIDLNISIEEAFQMIISLGVVTPTIKPPSPNL